MPKRLTSRAAGAAIAAVLVGATAQGQDAVSTPSSGTAVYEPDFFNRFAPQNALDMVNQVPGFSIEEVDQSRGLGQASGNVLINGERIAGKSNDAIDALRRIPATDVVRIELVDGGTLGIPGLSGRVVNVIAESGGLSGVFSWEARIRQDVEPRYNQGEFSLSGSRGTLDWTVALELDGDRFGLDGQERVFDGLGRLTEIRDDDFQATNGRTAGAVSLGWTSPSGHEANFDAIYSDFNADRRVRQTRQPIDGTDVFRVFRGGEDEWASEVSGDYTLPAFGGDLRFIGFYRHEDSRGSNQAISTDLTTGEQVSGTRFLQDFIENEAVGRAEFDWSTGTGRDWQVAGELAYNRLDAGSDLLALLPTGGADLLQRATPILVDEVRSEVSLTHTRQVTPKLLLQASLVGEYSELASEVGPDSQSQDFVRPKGYVSVAYTVSDAFTTTLRLDRDVGQLNLFDFVATRDLDVGNQEGGNRDVVPDQTWRASLEVDRNFGDLGGATLVLFHEEIEDLIDQVPLGPGITGPGNIDNAQRSGIELDTTLALDRFGFNGVQLSLVGEAQTSSVDDPLTGVSRYISEDKIAFVFSEIRWDIPNTPYAVSLAYEQFRDAQVYRTDELFDNNRAPGFASIEFEHKDLFGLNAFIQFTNLLDQQNVTQRRLFEPDRLGVLEEQLILERAFPAILLVGVSSSF